MYGAVVNLSLMNYSLLKTNILQICFKIVLVLCSCIILLCSFVIIFHVCHLGSFPIIFHLLIIFRSGM